MSGPYLQRGCLLVLLLGLLTACSEREVTLEDLESRGDAQLARGELHAAIASYRLAFHRDTLNPRILARLSQVYRRQGNQRAAGRYLRRATSLLYQRGVSALQAGDDSLARAEFMQTLELLPSHPLALNRLGDMALAHGIPDTAQMWYEKSLKANAHFVETQLKLGRLYMQQGRYAAAHRAFDAAIDLNINALQGYLGLGELALRQHHWTEAAAAFDKALRVHPGLGAAQAGLQRARSHL